MIVKMNIGKKSIILKFSEYQPNKADHSQHVKYFHFVRLIALVDVIYGGLTGFFSGKVSPMKMK